MEWFLMQVISFDTHGQWPPLWNFTCTWVDGCRFVNPIDSTISLEEPKETFAQIPMACGRLESVQSFMWNLGWSMPQYHLILEVKFEMRGLLYVHKLNPEYLEHDLSWLGTERARNRALHRSCKVSPVDPVDACTFACAPAKASNDVIAKWIAMNLLDLPPLTQITQAGLGHFLLH